MPKERYSLVLDLFLVNYKDPEAERFLGKSQLIDHVKITEYFVDYHYVCFNF